ncbi:MAG: VCBS repeat-containing protein [Candidatus Hydrogenedentota bacterium]
MGYFKRTLVLMIIALFFSESNIYAAWNYKTSPMLDDGQGICYGKVESGDMDNDGDLDLVVAGYDVTLVGRLMIFNNKGNYQFIKAAEPVINNNNNSKYRDFKLNLGDYDNDKDTDIILSGNFFSVFRNDTGSFTEINQPLQGNEAYIQQCYASFGDYNKDGYLDIALMGVDINDGFILHIYKYDTTTQTWGKVSEPANDPATDYIDGLGCGWLDWADFDNDGDLDLACTGENRAGNYRLIIIKNSGNDAFSVISEPLVDSGGSLVYGELDAGDFNNDGLIDLVVSGENYDYVPDAIILRNNGNFNFTRLESTSDVYDVYGATRSSARFGNYDGDTDLDLLFTGIDRSGVPSFAIFKNNNGTFTKDTEPVINYMGIYEGNAIWANLDTDGDNDIAIVGITDNDVVIFEIYENNSSSVVDVGLAAAATSATTTTASDTTTTASDTTTKTTLATATTTSDTTPFEITSDSISNLTPIVFLSETKTISFTSTKLIDTSSLVYISVAEDTTTNKVQARIIFDPTPKKIFITYDYKPGHTYYVKIRAQVSDIDGNLLGVDTEYSMRVYLPDSGGVAPYVDGNNVTLTFGEENKWLNPVITKSQTPNFRVGTDTLYVTYQIDVYDTAGTNLNDSLTQTVTATFYLESVAGNERIAYYNEATQAWEIISTYEDIDFVNKTITVTLTHFSIYGLLIVNSSTAIQIRSLSNPHTEFPIIFRALSSNDGNYLLKIIDLRSRPIFEIAGTIIANISLDINWSGITRNGRICPNGVYYVLFSVNNCKPVLWKIMIAR